MHVASLTSVSSMPLPARQRVCLRIGAASLGVSAGSEADLRLGPDHAAFEVDTHAECDMEVDVQWVETLCQMSSKRLFDSGALWTLHQGSDGLIFDFNIPMYGKQPYKRLIVDHDFSRAQLLANGGVRRRGFDIVPLEDPVDELLVTHWLTQGHGVEIHGCGLVDPVVGSQLFVGHSGAGKSTTTSMWTSLRNAKVLSDDRIVLRRSEGALWMYGTPWRGETGFASPERSKLTRIFIIEHGKTNEIVPLSRSRAMAELFARCCVPFYDARAIEFTLSFLHDITNTLPCYLFRFLPEPSAVEKVLGAQDE